MTNRPIAALLLLLAAPPARAADLVDAGPLVPGLVVEMRYAGSDNFTGAPVPGYEAPRCLLTPPAARALARVQADLAREGLGLKVFDCYRPARAVAHFVRWVRDPAAPGRKAAYYPDTDKADLIRLGYIAARSAHSRGSTVDLTLVRRADGGEVEMGSAYDVFGPVSATASPAVPPAARAARERLRAAMERGGFSPYAKEWWHFTLRIEPHPTGAFDVPVR